MTLTDAKKVVKGNTLILKVDNLPRTVFGIRQEGNTLYFRCNHNGDIQEYTHNEMRWPKSVDEEARLWMKRPNTRVFINYNNELGKNQWLYSVEVVDSDGFWLASFDTEAEAEEFIRENKLKKEK